MTHPRNVVPPPFSIFYVGFGKFIINKGFVFQANNGRKIDVTWNGEALTLAWTEEAPIIEIASGSTISLSVTHANKDDLFKYEIADLESAEIVISEPDELESKTVTAIKIAEIEYETPVSDPKILQFLNSDAYLAIFGTKAVGDA